MALTYRFAGTCTEGSFVDSDTPRKGRPDERSPLDTGAMDRSKGPRSPPAEMTSPCGAMQPARSTRGEWV